MAAKRPAKKAKVRAAYSFRPADPRFGFIVEGEEFDADHPVVEQQPTYFKPVGDD
jgi:hypothetical protein